MTSIKKPVLLLAATGITAVISIGYFRLLKPAQAREIQAACRGMKPAPSNGALGRLPAAAPDFAAQDHTGAIVHLSDLRGKVVLVRFWGSWCETCKSEQPSLEALADDWADDDDDLVVLSVASDESWDAVRTKLANGSHTRVLIDPPDGDEAVGPIGRAYGVQKVPESFVVDRNGIVRYYFVNKRDWRGSVARTCLRSILDE